jgi:hypothetical protein
VGRVSLFGTSREVSPTQGPVGGTVVRDKHSYIALTRVGFIGKYPLPPHK